MHIDEHILAGYLAGELTDNERSSVTNALLNDRSLREWLHMAAEALAVSRQHAEDSPLLGSLPGMEPARPGVPRADRRAEARGVRRTG